MFKSKSFSRFDQSASSRPLTLPPPPLVPLCGIDVTRGFSPIALHEARKERIEGDELFVFESETENDAAPLRAQSFPFLISYGDRSPSELHALSATTVLRDKIEFARLSLSIRKSIIAISDNKTAPSPSCQYGWLKNQIAATMLDGIGKSTRCYARMLDETPLNASYFEKDPPFFSPIPVASTHSLSETELSQWLKQK